MVWAICTVLMVIWLMGLVTGRTLHGFVHLLPVLAGITAFAFRRRLVLAGLGAARPTGRVAEKSKSA